MSEDMNERKEQIKSTKSTDYNEYTENLHYDSNTTYLFPTYQVVYGDYTQGTQKTITIDSLPALNYWIEQNFMFNSPINVCQITKVYTIKN